MAAVAPINPNSFINIGVNTIATKNPTIDFLIRIDWLFSASKKCP